MTDRIDTEALRALVAAKDMHDNRGVLCVTSEHEDQSWGMSVSICEPFDTDKIVKSLAAEVLELRAKLAECLEDHETAARQLELAAETLRGVVDELAAEKARADTLPEMALSVVAYELSCAGYDDAYTYASGKYIKRMVEDQCRRKAQEGDA